MVRASSRSLEYGVQTALFFYFHRAKSVCSSWLSASKQCLPKDNRTPWLILFPEEQNNSHCKLFNPEEKERLYRTQDTRLDFSKSVCKATYGTWLLMQNLNYNLYIVNLFTNKRFTLYLPPIESKVVNEERKHSGIDRIVSTVLWIDDKTNDYVVLCNVDNLHVVYYKKSKGYWKEIPETSKCYDMVYNDHRLYLLSYHGGFSIFDFHGKIPLKTIQRVLKVESVYNHQISSQLSTLGYKACSHSDRKNPRGSKNVETGFKDLVLHGYQALFIRESDGTPMCFGCSFLYFGWRHEFGYIFDFTIFWKRKQNFRLKMLLKTINK